MSGVRRALIISTGDRYVSIVLNFATLAIVSRLMTPAEIGLSVLGLAALSIAEAIRDFGASAYLVQQRDISKQSIRTAFTIMLLLTSGLVIGIMLAAGYLAQFYRNEQLAAFIRLTAIGFLSAPFSGTLMALLRRDLEFGRLAIVSVGGQLVTAGVTIALAFGGVGFMSFAWAGLASGVTTALLALAMRPTPWAFVPLLADWREVLKFGAISCATALVNQSYNVLAALVMGRAQAPAAVGLYSRAQTICQIPDRLVLSGIGSVALAALSRRSRDGQSLKDAYLHGLSMISVIYWPILCLLALLAAPVINLMLGPQWREAVPLVQITATAYLMLFPAVLSYPTLVASGGIADALRSSLVSLPPSALIIGAAAIYGPTAVAMSQFATIPLQVGVVMWFIKRRIGFAWGELVKALARSSVVAFSTFAVAWIATSSLTGSIESEYLQILWPLTAAIPSWLVAAVMTKHPIFVEHLRPLMGSRRFIERWASG